MLRRNSTRSKADLQRRKSTSSVRSVHLEHIDAASAQRDANRAAAYAFARGRERSSEAEMQNFPLQPQAPQREQCNDHGVAGNNSVASQKGDENGQDLKRRQSVRFVRPQSSQSRTSRQGGCSEVESNKPPRSIYTPSITQTNRSLRANDRRSMGNFRLSMRSSPRSDPQTSTAMSRTGFVHTLAEHDVFYTPEDDIASMPSSYRRLRKTRSMFVPERASPVLADSAMDRTQATTFLSVVSPNGIQELPYSCSVGYHPGSSHKENRPISATPNLKAPKSMSFLRNRRERLDSLTSRAGNEVAGNGLLAHSPKSNFENLSRRSRLISKPSTIFKPKTIQPEPGMKKTLRRSSSGGALPVSSTFTSLQPIKDGAFRKRARKVSSSLKSKIKTFFNFHKVDNEVPQFPEQQVEAQKTHVSPFFDGRFYGNDTGIGSVRHEEVSLSRVSSHVPTLHSVSQSELLHFRKGSLESIGTKVRKVSEDKSRVTSWTNSDTEPLASPHLHPSVEECEKQRLSVIREVGLYAPSATPIPQCPQEPILQPQDQLANAKPIVNSDRVYSALMKRANETKQLAEIVEQQRKSSGTASDPFRTVTSDTSTNESCHGGDGRGMLCNSQHTETLDEGCQGTIDPSAIHRATVIDQTESDKDQHMSTGPSPTIRVVPRIRAPHAAPVTLGHRSSAFFGSPECHFFRTKSPYRRALHETMNSQEGDHDLPAESHQTTLNSHHQLCHTETFGSDVAGKPVYSDSIYSGGNVDDREISPLDTSITRNVPQSSSMFEDASVFVDVPAYRPRGSLGQTSPTGQIDWEAWLSANASKLEPQSSPTYSRDGKVTEVKYALPTMPNAFDHEHGPRHVRELAQIDDQEGPEIDPDIQGAQPPMTTNAPFGVVEPNVVKLSPRYRSGVMKNSPNQSLLQENAAPSAFEPAKPLSSITSTPLVPSKSPLRQLTTQNLKSTNSARNLRAVKLDSPHTPIQAASATARRTKSLARLRSLHNVRTTNSGSPHAFFASTSLEHRGDPVAISGSVTSSPLLSAAVLRQFGSGSYQDNAGAMHDEFGMTRICRHDNEAQTPGSPNTEIETQLIGSKKMVENFLSSRRRRMTSEDESLAFV